MIPLPSPSALPPALLYVRSCHSNLMNKRAATYQLSSLLLLILAAALAVSGLGFPGLDLFVALLLAAPLGLAAASVLNGGGRAWSVIIALLAAMGLVFHLILNFGLL